MVKFGLFQMAQTVAGLSAAGPVVVMSARAFETGDVWTGAALLGVAAVAFVLPGYLLARYIEAIRSAPRRFVVGVKAKLLGLLPFRGRDGE